MHQLGPNHRNRLFRRLGYLRMVLLFTRTELMVVQMLAEGLRAKQIIDKCQRQDISMVSRVMSLAVKRNKLKTLNQLLYEYARNPHRVTNPRKGKRTPNAIKRSSTVEHA